jgi:hypothetical protein
LTQIGFGGAFMFGPSTANDGMQFLRGYTHVIERILELGVLPRDSVISVLVLP